MQLEFEFLSTIPKEYGEMQDSGYPDSRPIKLVEIPTVAITVFNERQEPILLLHRDGRVEAETVEKATEAGRIFVQVIRDQLSASRQ